MSIKTELLDQLKSAADNYAAALKNASSDALSRRPDEKNWAPVEIICHARDVEEIYMCRFKTILEVNDYRFQTADADRWADERQYIRNDTSQALTAFRGRRKETIAFIKTLSPEQLERTGIHPRLGQKTLADLVNGMADHDASHLDQLRHALSGQA